MCPLFMDTLYENQNPGSQPVDLSNLAGSETEGEEQQTGTNGLKRRVKNRDAARKSRKKQTERADELHEELQSLEQSNSALQKEITGLKKELQIYQAALEQHEPSCRHKASADRSGSSGQSVFTSSSVRTTSNSTSPPSFSTSAASRLTLQPEIATFYLAPFPNEPQSTPRPGSVGSAAARPPSGQDAVKDHASGSGNTYCTVDNFSPSQESYQTALPNAVPPYSHLMAGSRAAAKRVSCLHPFHYSANPNRLLPSSLPNPAPLFSSDPCPGFTLKPHQQFPADAPPLLSLLTVPSPPNVPHASSSAFDGSPSDPPPSANLSLDLSLSELLEGNDWILSGADNP